MKIVTYLISLLLCHLGTCKMSNVPSLSIETPERKGKEGKEEPGLLIFGKLSRRREGGGNTTHRVLAHDRRRFPPSTADLHRPPPISTAHRRFSQFTADFRLKLQCSPGHIVRCLHCLHDHSSHTFLRSRLEKCVQFLIIFQIFVLP